MSKETVEQRSLLIFFYDYLVNNDKLQRNEGHKFRMVDNFLAAHPSIAALSNPPQRTDDELKISQTDISKIMVENKYPYPYAKTEDGKDDLNIWLVNVPVASQKILELILSIKLNETGVDKQSQSIQGKEEWIDEVKKERARQDEKWGEQNHAPNDWLTILMEEVGEVSKAALEFKFGGETLKEYRKELIQVAAIAIAMIECYDRNSPPVNNNEEV